MQFRPAEQRDIDVLVDLLGVLFAVETEYPVDRRRQRQGLELLLESATARVIVAEEQGRVIGMVSGQLVVSTAEGAWSLLVEDLVVDSAMRGRGCASALLSVIAGWGAANGATRLQLLADHRNSKALAFYERRGWRRTAMVALHHSVLMAEDRSDMDSVAERHQAKNGSSR